MYIAFMKVMSLSGVLVFNLLCLCYLRAIQLGITRFPFSYFKCNVVKSTGVCFYLAVIFSFF